jgi:isopentenyl phosphate kinase
MDSHELIFLKLGGSLITDKNQPLTARPKTIKRIAKEIKKALEENPGVRLLIGHGSGSFGHAIADVYHTQEGGWDQRYWQGFSEVWFAARELNQLVVESFHQEGLPLISFPPSAGVIAENKEFKSWDIRPIEFALAQGLIPLVQGDVIFDTEIGGTIFSTEKSFVFLCKNLHPEKILLAGWDIGVYKDNTDKNTIFSRITPEDVDQIRSTLSGSDAVDVTGGMSAKVMSMLTLVKENPSLKVQIFSGMEPGNIKKALNGEVIGTLLEA